jgi:transglutaminase-like putative cysteine protease
MATDKVMDDFYYDTDGVGIQYSQEYIRLRNRANEILAQTGKNPQAIYTYVCNHVKYKYDPQKDWTTMANSAFDSGRGACYNFAACVDILLKLSGYETRVVRGTGHYTSLHYWNQVKINGAWTNIDACNKYYNVSDAYLKSKTYTFDKYEYPQYY